MHTPIRSYHTYMHTECIRFDSVMEHRNVQAALTLICCGARGSVIWFDICSEDPFKLSPKEQNRSGFSNEYGNY